MGMLGVDGSGKRRGGTRQRDSSTPLRCAQNDMWGVLLYARNDVWGD